MLVLLPPSEAKAAPARGAPVDLAALAFADALRAPREAVLAALDPVLRTAPAARASRVYTGVLFQRLRLGELPARARRRVLIASALWGVVRPDDRIPAYKLPIGTRLAPLGPLAAFWRPALSAALPPGGLVVDLRSGPYAAVWTPAGGSVVRVRAFTERPDGTRAVISHMVKAVRGDVARVLLGAGRPPRTPEAVRAALAEAGYRVESTPDRAGATLDVVLAG